MSCFIVPLRVGCLDLWHLLQLRTTDCFWGHRVHDCDNVPVHLWACVCVCSSNWPLLSGCVWGWVCVCVRLLQQQVGSIFCCRMNPLITCEWDRVLKLLWRLRFHFLLANLHIIRCLFHNLYIIKVKLYSPVLALSLTSLQFARKMGNGYRESKRLGNIPQVNRLMGNRCLSPASPNGSVVLKDGARFTTLWTTVLFYTTSQLHWYCGCSILAQHWCVSPVSFGVTTGLIHTLNSEV